MIEEVEFVDAVADASRLALICSDSDRRMFQSSILITPTESHANADEASLG